MRGNTFGKLFSLTSFGESHGPAIGVVIDGVPSNLNFSQDDLQKALDRRAPGKILGTSDRKEEDKAIVLSGIFEGKTLGTPIAVIVNNTNQKNSDYDHLKNVYRPGHADKTYDLKYGIRDHRGGGRSSGRETIARVIAGYFASLVLPKVKVEAGILQMGEQKFATPLFELTDKEKNYLENLKKNGHSVGGTIQVTVEQCPVGLGEPAFDKLKADFAKGLLSIGACISFSIEPGGIEGGISNGNQIVMIVGFKPTSTTGENAKQGRHDPCILPRAMPVVEAMVKIILADHYLRQNAYRIS
jgi:chorismate synthase